MSLSERILVLDDAHPTKAVASRRSARRGVWLQLLFLHLVSIYAFIFGGMGHGKTTLLLACGQEWWEEDRNGEILSGGLISATF